VATAVCDRALLFALVWLLAAQSQEPNGTSAATDLVRNDSRFPLLRRMRTWLPILGASRSRSSHEWTAGKRSNIAERDLRHIAGFTF
jgi:hypothetical protein